MVRIDYQYLLLCIGPGLADDAREMTKIKLYLVSFVILFLNIGLLAGRARVDEAIPLEAAPMLFADDTGIRSKNRLDRTFHPGMRRNRPVVVADRPWEVQRVYMATVHYDESEKLFKMWYLARIPPDKPGEQVEDIAEGLETCLLYAYSKDGLNWEKPALNQVSINGSTANNVIDFPGGGGGEASVLMDPFEVDPERRYKLLIHNKNGYSLGLSADGIRWREHSNNPVFDHGDTAKIAQDPFTGEYLAYYKRPAFVNGFPRRVVWLSRSMDFDSWSDPQMVFSADEADDAWAYGPDHRMEVYLMSVFPHAAGFLGFPAMFLHTPQHLDGSPTPGGGELSSAGGAVSATGPMDVQLITSPDGVHWERTYPRLSMITRGAPGSYDGGSIYNCDSSPVHVGDQTWVYYTAINTGHGAPVPPKVITIGRAEWRRNGFASLDAGPEGGELVTVPVVLGKHPLLINADAESGELVARLEEIDGSPIEGYGFSEFISMRENSTAWIARWKGQSTLPQNHPVCVRIKLANARLYSLENRPIKN